MNEEQTTIEKYAPLSKMELSNKEQEQIWMNVEQRIKSVSQRTPKRRSHVFGTSAAAVAAVLIVAGGVYVYASHNLSLSPQHPSSVTGTDNNPPSNVAPSATEPISFDFSKYLSFTPMLPSYTAGYELTHSQIDSSINNPQGNTIWYTASFGNSAFVVSESKPNDAHLAPEPWTSIKIDNLDAQMYKHDGGESVKFVQGGVLYDITTISGGISYQELHKVCTSIGRRATARPNMIHLSISGSAAESQVEAGFVTPKTYTVPSGFTLDVESLDTAISPKKTTHVFSMTYKKGSSYVTVQETNGGDLPSVFPSFQYQQKQISGITVYSRRKTAPQSPQLPAAGFLSASTHVQYVIDTNVDQSVLNQFLSILVQQSSN
jgi:hypothetical protein